MGNPSRVVFIMQAMLDKLALEMEKNKLMEENVKLSTVLRNHLDGLTIAERLKTAYNVLMVRYSPPPNHLKFMDYLFIFRRQMEQSLFHCQPLFYKTIEALKRKWRSSLGCKQWNHKTWRRMTNLSMSTVHFFVSSGTYICLICTIILFGHIESLYEDCCL